KTEPLPFGDARTPGIPICYRPPLRSEPRKPITPPDPQPDRPPRQMVRGTHCWPAQLADESLWVDSHEHLAVSEYKHSHQLSSKRSPCAGIIVSQPSSCLI